MNLRKVFFQSLIKDSTKRILELGPLNYPVAEKASYPNTFYCDIRSTEELRALYSGNDYLAATGIEIDVETIVPVDYVVKDGYSKSLSTVEKFDYVIASHVLEHVNDLIFALRDIAQLLKPGGIFCIVYPDKRYCFDHFRTSASFRDAYHVFRGGTKNNAPMVLDFYYSVIPENNPVLFWNQDGILNELPRASYENAEAHYERVLDGEKMDDIHYWPFTDMDFLKFLYDCTRARLLPFRLISFCPCVKDGQQFMVALQLDPTAIENPERALRDLRQWMGKALPDFYSAKDISLKTEKEALENQLELIKEQVQGLRSVIKQQADENKALHDKSETVHSENELIRIQLSAMTAQFQSIENSTIWRATKPLRTVLDFIKRSLKVGK
ncbi:MAG: class I SAM-dependent methyltransferase [Ruminococcus flavefaciens]|nr:class I SAM-dependent methyltransferase [Ruminococcus flavefaciens]